MGEVESCIARSETAALRKWLLEKAPRGSESDFEIVIATPDGTISVHSSDAYANQRIPMGCLQDAMLGAFATALADDGIVELDESIGKFLPKLMHEAEPAKNIRFSDLLSHSSGVWIGSLANLDVDVATWDDFCAYLSSSGVRFPPARVVTYSLIERMILVKTLEHVLNENPFDVLRAKLLDANSGIEFVPMGGDSGNGLGEVHGRLRDFLDFFHRSRATSWFERLNTGQFDREFVNHPIGKSWAPRKVSLGMFRLGNGVWGQDGGTPADGFLGFRVSARGDKLVVGRFRSPFERERILARVCEDMMELPAGTDPTLMGDLNGFDLPAIQGEYEGFFGATLFVDVSEGQCVIKAHKNDETAMPLKVGKAGQLSARWAIQNIWVEPQHIGIFREPGIRIGQQIFLKKISVSS